MEFYPERTGRQFLGPTSMILLPTGAGGDPQYKLHFTFRDHVDIQIDVKPNASVFWAREDPNRRPSEAPSPNL